jgi:hypothetical protein
MIGRQPTGAVPGVVICSVIHEGLRVIVDGKPGRLAIVDDEGHVIAVGDQVAREAEAVAINAYRNFLESKGWLRTYSAPIKPVAPPDRSAR